MQVRAAGDEDEALWCDRERGLGISPRRPDRPHALWRHKGRHPCPDAGTRLGVAPFGIRVVSVNPGSVDTEMLREDCRLESARTGRGFEEIKGEREAEQAFRRWAAPEEIASVVRFVASDGASYITGSDVLVDCGWTSK